MQRVAKQYLTPENRVVVITHAESRAAPKEVSAMIADTHGVCSVPQRLAAVVLRRLATRVRAAAADVRPTRRRPRASCKKGKVPVSNEILKVKLPKAAEADLSNGVHLMVLEDHRAPQVQFQLIIPGAGGYYDPAEQSGAGRRSRPR